MQRIDNEVSKILIESIESKGLKYQLASPHDHRLNPAERAVQTWKNHFISNLHGCDSEFPAYKWCEIMHQCEMTLNMLRRSRINPKMSAYTQLFGSFDYNRTPLAPLGTKAFVHERTGQRRSHADHGKVGYVIGNSPQHYRHLYFYLPSTRGNRHTDTYVFIPSKFELPANAAADRATIALEEFTVAMKAKRNRDIPFINNSINNAIGVLSKLLQPTRQVTTSTATRPRVINGVAQRPRVDNNNVNDVQGPRVNNNNRNNAQRPRVNNNNRNNVQRPRVDTNNNVPTQRVLRPRAKVHKQKYPRGTRVYKIFGETTRLVEHKGYISDFDKKEGYYKVRYHDGDSEECTEEEIATMLKPTEKNTNVMRALATTKHERIIEQYAKMETVYTPPPKFLGGLSKAMECVEMMALEAVNTTFGTIGGQNYHYANAVIDEETGDVMNLKKLLKHPKYMEVWTRAAAK